MVAVCSLVHLHCFDNQCLLLLTMVTVVLCMVQFEDYFHLIIMVETAHRSFLSVLSLLYTVEFLNEVKFFDFICDFSLPLFLDFIHEKSYPNHSSKSPNFYESHFYKGCLQMLKYMRVICCKLILLFTSGQGIHLSYTHNTELSEKLPTAIGDHISQLTLERKGIWRTPCFKYQSE